MLFNAFKILPFLALCGLSSGKSSMAGNNRKRDTTSVSIYAYGGETNGAPVFYDNGGLAYIGHQKLDSDATNITFTVNTSNHTTPWYITANSSDSNSTASFTGSPMLYIVPDDGAQQQVGFAANSSAVPTGGKTSGFAWFGKSVAYAGSASDYQMNFWAVKTNATGFWALHWNSNGTAMQNGSPVTLKSTPPTTRS